MVMLGELDPEYHKHPESGDFDIDQFYNPKTGEHMLGNFRVPCAHCQRKVRTFKITHDEDYHSSYVTIGKYVGVSYPWVGLDYQNIVQHYVVPCLWCKKQFSFGLLFPQ